MGFTMLKPVRRAPSGAVAMAPRSPSLAGKVVGTLWNNRANGDQFLHQLGDELRRRYGVAEVIHRKKVYNNSRAPLEVLQELKEKCDAVVVGVGD